MRVVVAAGTDQTVAGSALDAEGIEYTLAPCEGDHGYGELLHDLFRSGEGFIILEDDIAPWPGAIAELIACPKRWCAFDYPVGHGVMVSQCSHWGLGIFKIVADLAGIVDTTSWRKAHWHDLDHRVNAAILAVASKPLHVHTPPVAHAQHHRIGRPAKAGAFFA